MIFVLINNNNYILLFIKFFLGIGLSIIYSYFILPKKSGSNPSIKITLYPILYNGMVIIPFNHDKAIHLHHWIIYLFICISSFFINIPIIIIGFSAGLFIQGITYNDSLNIICNNPYYF